MFGVIFQFFSLFLNSTLALWSPELYPTRIRALGCSTVNGVGNVAGAVMPFAAVFIFGQAGIAGVFLMIAVMYTILAVSARFAPETMGQPLEDYQRTGGDGPLERSLRSRNGYRMTGVRSELNHLLRKGGAL